MAVLLAAFQLLGIQPGPAMLSTNLKITYFLIWIMVIAHVIGAGICLALARPMARVAFIPAGTLMPIIACLVLVGAVSDSITWANFVVLLGMGFAAWLMRLTGWSMAPVILGFVLGKSGETFVMQSYLVYGMSWLHWPIVDAILGVSVLFAISTARRRKKNRRLQEANGGANAQFTAMTFRGGTALSVTVSFMVTAIAIAAAIDSLTWRQPNVAGAVGQATIWPFLGALLPLFACGVIILFGSFETFLEFRLFRQKRRAAGPMSTAPLPVPEPALVGAAIGLREGIGVEAELAPSEEVLPEPVAAPVNNRKSIYGFMWLVGATLLSYLLGFAIALPIFAIVYLILGKHKVWTSVLTGGLICAGYWLIFVHLLNTNLPFSLIFGPVWY
jgi:hypothetical protein